MVSDYDFPLAKESRNAEFDMPVVAKDLVLVVGSGMAGRRNPVYYHVYLMEVELAKFSDPELEVAYF